MKFRSVYRFLSVMGALPFSLITFSSITLAQSTGGDLYSPEIVVVSPEKGDRTTKQGLITFEGIVLSYKLRLADVAVYVNDTVTFRTKPESQFSFRYPFRVEVKLQPGPNVVTIVARNEKSQSKFSSGRIVYEPSSASEKPKLTVLAIGVSGNSDADVDAFVKTISQHNKCSLANLEMKALKGAEATRRGILTGLSWLNKQSQSETDVKILYIRGAITQDSSGDYYLLSSGQSLDTEPELDGVELNLLWQRASSTPGPLVVLLDVHFVGYTSSAWLERAIRPTGNAMVFLNPKLWKSSDPASSPFTLALLEGLGKADVSRDGLVDVQELQMWLKKRPEFANSKQPIVFGYYYGSRKPAALTCTK